MTDYEYIEAIMALKAETLRRAKAHAALLHEAKLTDRMGQQLHESYHKLALRRDTRKD